jgi:predicted Zn-dependent protease
MHLRVPDFLPLTVLFVWTCVAGLAAEKPLADLEREANEVLSDPDNVSRRKRIAPVFELASRYARAGATNKALSFYAKGLEHHPWNLEAQVTVAELLLGTGDAEKAREKATLVFNRAETDTLLGRAAMVLGTPFESTLPDPEPWPVNTNALALVPVGEIDAWLLRDLRRELQDALQMPVIIQRRSMTISKPGRDALHLKAEDLRERIGKAKNDPAFQAMLRQHKLSTQGLDDDEQVFALTEKILETERDKDQVSRFREELTFLRRLGPQWDSVPLLDQLKKTSGAVGGSARGVLGVTKLDLYANQSRYVFGMAGNGMNCGIISYWRYRSALVEEPPNRDRLRERTLKQALSSTGLLFGLPRCTEPTCARAYANDLAEHDSKQPSLCVTCKEAFAKRFRK